MLRYWKFAAFSTALALFSFIVPLHAAPGIATATYVTSIDQPSPATFGTPVSNPGVTYTVSIQAASMPSTPTGTVSFFVDGNAVGTCSGLTLVNGTTTCFVPAGLSGATLFVGTHSITATYSGDGTYLATGAGGSVAQPYSQVIVKYPLAPANLTVTITPVGGPVFSQSATATATISGISTALLSGGSMQFAIDGSSIGSPVAVASGSASFTFSSPAGQHTIAATYSGDPNVSNDSNSAPVTVQPAATTVVLTASPTGSTTAGTPVTYTATVSANAPATATTVPGSVSFYLDGSTGPFATATLSSNTASSGPQTFPLAGSPHTVTAVYTDTVNNNFSSSTSNPVTATITASPTTVSVADAAGQSNPSPFATAVSFTVTVTPTPVVAGKNPTGTVTLNVNNGAASFTGSLSAGAGGTSNVTITLPKLALILLPANSVVATYTGDTTFAGSTSSTFTQNVTPGPTTTTITSSTPASLIYGQQVNIQAVVAVPSPPVPAPVPPAPPGTITFSDTFGALPGSPVTLNAITANYIYNLLAPGAHSITAGYNPNPNAGNVTGSTSSAVNFTISKASTTNTLSTAQAPASAPNTLALTSIITVNAPGGGTPTGFVRFYSLNGTNLLGQAPLNPVSTNQFSAVLIIQPFNGSVSSVYSGDGNFNGSTSQVIPLQAPASFPTYVTLTASQNPITIGQTVTFTATIGFQNVGFQPQGNVQFLDGTTPLGAVAPAAGVATFTTTLSAGDHSIFANFLGDSRFLPSGTNIGESVTRIPSTTSLSANTTSPTYGQSVTLTITLGPAAPGGIAGQTGTVNIQDGGNVIGSIPATTHTFTIPLLGAGGHQITAWYQGDANWFPSNSSSVLVNVAQASTTTTLTTSGQSTTTSLYTATVTSTAGTPTGSVSFIDTNSQAVLATATLTAGSATAPVVAGRSVMAVYSGDANFLPSSSSPIAMLSISNAASFNNNAYSFAAGEIATLMGSNLSTGTAAATFPLPTILSGTTVNVTDSKGVTRAAQLYFVSPAQVNFVIPTGTAAGPATVSLTEVSGPSFLVAITVVAVDPGLFFQAAGGTNIAQAVVIDQPPTGPSVATYTAVYSAGVWSANPIVLNSTDQFYIELFGTGIQNAPSGSVSATINGVAIPVTYAGWSNDFPGVDQVNIGPLPASLAGTGAVPLVLTVYGQTANTVTVSFK